MENEIIPAILVETFDEFLEKLEVAEEFAQTVQWDVMDGQFVGSVTFNDPTEITKSDTSLTIEAHLMVENPEEMFENLATAGVDRVIVHAEAVDSLSEIIDHMEKFDFEKGVAINPETEISILEEVIDRLDMVLVMTVTPGAGGQTFMAEELEKVKALRQEYPDLNIGVDGGVNLQTIKKAKEAGANRFGVNSAIFDSPDPVNAFEVLENVVNA
jgi:ribulose-phosphate 3-epimerase